MGDRALVIFTDGSDVSPTVYLHWSGSAVPEILTKHAAFMESRKGDVQYAAARFVGLCHVRLEDSNLSLGMWNTAEKVQDAIRKSIDGGDPIEAEELLADESHGDAGVVVVNVNNFAWKAYGGYLADRTKAA